MRVGLILQAAVVVVVLTGTVWAGEPVRVVVTDYGVVGDGTTVNTTALQGVIDERAAGGGGTVVVPKGTFVSGALFVKAGVNMELGEGAVLQGSKKAEDFPVLEGVRFEGHFQKHAASLLNVDHCDHFRLSGPGTLDGNGVAYWKANLPLGRPRLCEITNSADVAVSGVHFENSASWNLHFYNCHDVTVEKSRFEIPEKTKGPSTDGTDIDSSQNVTVKDCFYSVDDDCVCLKGNRYDGLDQEPKSLPVDGVHVLNCTFARGMGAVVLGTEATVIRNVEFQDSTVTGKMPMLRVKYRPDTAGQAYANIHVHDITLDGPGVIVSLEPSHGTKVDPDKAAKGSLSHVTIEGIKGSFGAFGTWAGTKTAVKDITVRNVDVKLSKDGVLHGEGVEGLVMEHVVVNGEEQAATTRPAEKP